MTSPVLVLVKSKEPVPVTGPQQSSGKFTRPTKQSRSSQPNSQPKLIWKRDQSAKVYGRQTGASALCQCKATANGPFCDGTHASLAELKAGVPAPAPKSDTPMATPTSEEPTVVRIHALAKEGLSKLGHHGEMGAMGVPRKDLSHWDDIQILPAQMAREPLLDDQPVTTSVTIGPRAAKPLQLDTPLFVSDMSYGALSEEAKVALLRGASRRACAIRTIALWGLRPKSQSCGSGWMCKSAPKNCHAISGPRLN